MAVFHFSSAKELEYQHSPSRWSKRMGSDAVLKEHDTQTKLSTERARQMTQCALGVKYGETNAVLDIYYPSSSKEADYSDCPVFVYIHGGYWYSQTIDNGGVMAIPFTKAGVIVVAMDFTSCKDGGTITQIVNECRSACCFVRKKFPRNRLFLSGHSSGNHLAACLMCTNWESHKMTNPNIAGVVFYSGYFDLEVFQKHDENSIVQVTDQEAKDFTPKYNVRALSVPKECSCMFYYTEYDTDEYKKQGKDLMKALQGCGIKCKFEVFPQLDHFDLIDNLQFDDNKLNKEILHFIKEMNG